MKKLNQLVFSIIVFLIFTASIYSQSQFTWKALPNAPYTAGRGEDIYFLNPYTGWLVRSIDSNSIQLPNLYKTTDGGGTWINLSDTSIGYPRCIGFANAQAGWIGTYFGDTTGIFKTTDGGETWFKQIAVPTMDSVGICGMHVLDENTVRACGRWNGPPKFYKTDNGGTNWVIKDLSAYADRLIDVYFFSPDSGIVVGGIGPNIYSGKGVVLFTSDGGETWNTRFTTPHNEQWGWKINFPTRDVGYISLEKVTGFNSYILKTTDGGHTWSELFVKDGIALNQEGIGFINENTGWLGGWWMGIYKTTNGGNNWIYETWGENVNRFRFFGDTLGYAVGQTVYKYELDTSIGISTLSTEIPDRPELSQNYPNPFNPSTVIKFQVLDYEDTKLSIFDVLGREVAVLVNQKLYPGYYEYKFDASGLESGVYFYRIETFRYTETKKMLLIK